MGLKVTNNAFGALNAGISNSDTVVVLQAGQGARFPVLGAGDYFYATLIDTSNNLEIVKVTARATDTLTVVRAQDGTTARAYNVNDRFELRPTAALFNEIITGTGLEDNAIASRLIAPDAVTTAKINNGAVTDAKIAAMAASKLTGRVPAANANLGAVLQVVQASSTTRVSTSSSTPQEFGLSASITPTSTSSKILVFVSAAYGGSGTSVRTAFHVFRGSSSLTSTSIARTGGVGGTCSYEYLDSPSTSSSVTYSVRMASLSETSISNDYSGQCSFITLMEIAA